MYVKLKGKDNSPLLIFKARMMIWKIHLQSAPCIVCAIFTVSTPQHQWIMLSQRDVFICKGPKMQFYPSSCIAGHNSSL